MVAESNWNQALLVRKDGAVKTVGGGGETFFRRVSKQQAQPASAARQYKGAGTAALRCLDNDACSIVERRPDGRRYLPRCYSIDIIGSRNCTSWPLSVAPAVSVLPRPGHGCGSTTNGPRPGRPWWQSISTAALCWRSMACSFRGRGESSVPISTPSGHFAALYARRPRCGSTQRPTSDARSRAGH